MTPRAHHTDYDEATTGRCERVLLTLLGDLGPWGQRIYLAGGLAPRYLVGRLPEGARAHVGTTDVDLVIGADGLHSRVRRLVFGSDDKFEVSLGYHVAAFEVEGHYHVTSSSISATGFQDDRYPYFPCVTIKLSSFLFSAAST